MWPCLWQGFSYTGSQVPDNFIRLQFFLQVISGQSRFWTATQQKATKLCIFFLSYELFLLYAPPQKIIPGQKKMSGEGRGLVLSSLKTFNPLLPYNEFEMPMIWFPPSLSGYKPIDV